MPPGDMHRTSRHQRQKVRGLIPRWSEKCAVSAPSDRRRTRLERQNITVHISVTAMEGRLSRDICQILIGLFERIGSIENGALLLPYEISKMRSVRCSSETHQMSPITTFEKRVTATTSHVHTFMVFIPPPPQKMETSADRHEWRKWVNET